MTYIQCIREERVDWLSVFFSRYRAGKGEIPGSDCTRLPKQIPLTIQGPLLIVFVRHI